jgi:hypothetical protein
MLYFSTEFNMDGEPINRKYVPEIRLVDELYLEDKAHEREYSEIVDDDEDVTVTPNDPHVMKLEYAFCISTLILVV